MWQDVPLDPRNEASQTATRVLLARLDIAQIYRSLVKLNIIPVYEIGDGGLNPSGPANYTPIAQRQSKRLIIVRPKFDSWSVYQF